MLLYLQKNEHSSQYLFCLENHGIQKKIRLHNLFTQIGNKVKEIAQLSVQGISYAIESEIADPSRVP